MENANSQSIYFKLPLSLCVVFYIKGGRRGDELRIEVGSGRYATFSPSNGEDLRKGINFNFHNDFPSFYHF